MDPCTTDMCFPGDGACLYAPSGAPGCCTVDAECDDGLQCTVDVCGDAGACANSGGPCVQPLAAIVCGSKGKADGELDAPRGLAIGPDGRVYVADSGNGRISVFSAVGTWEEHWAAGELSQPAGMDWLPDGRLAVADTGNDRVAIVGPTGAVVDSWDGDSGEKTELDGPTDVAATPEGGVWVANAGKSNVIRLGADGALAQTLGKKGDAVGSFRIPRGVWLAPSGALYVSDSDQQRVTVYDPGSESPTLAFGVEGDGQGQFSFPGGILGLPSGYIAVADPGNHRVQFFRACQPECADGAECGSNGCGGACGECVGNEAVCEDGVCTGPLLGGQGCDIAEEGVTGCGGCGCEECVCAADEFCCATAWDDVCAGECAIDCGAVCGLGTPQLEPVVAFSAELLAGQSPTQLAIDAFGHLWVIDNITSNAMRFDIEY